MQLASTLGLQIDKLSMLLSPDLIVDQACDPTLLEPNLSLNLEICDLINNKQKNYPKDVAFAITRNINSRTKQSAILACNLLDCCVKNCGFPFHLVIASKEFLNSIVKRFPDRPLNIGPVQFQILSLIGQWNYSLATVSRHKDDFKNINDMFRLLQYKGYRFPELNELNHNIIPENPLKSEQELEDEDKLAHAAKLQALLRNGSPAALEEANDLMKVMAGYDHEKLPDYKKMFEDELDKIRSNSLVLSGILDAKKPGDRFDRDPHLHELHGQVKSAQSRIQKMITEADDESRVERLLELNDLINTVLNNYDCFVNGKDGKKPVVVPTKSSTPAPSSSVNIPESKNGPICLIDFDDVPSQQASSYSPPRQAAKDLDLLSDFASLNFSNSAPQSLPSFQSPNMQPVLSGRASPFNLSNQIATNPQPQDDIFAEFTSVNPTTSPPRTQSEATLFNKNGLQIIYKYRKTNTGLEGTVTYINTTPAVFTDVLIQYALPKSMTLNIGVCESSILQPLNVKPIVVDFNVFGGGVLKARVKVRYCVNGAWVEDAGEYSE